MQKKTKIWLFSLFVLGIAAPFLLANYSLASEQTTLTQIRNILHKSYIKPEQIPTGNYQSITGFLSELDDPYTSYFTPEQAKNFLAILENKISGIGAVLKLNKQKIPEITRILPNSPAQLAWLQIGDTIVAIDGKIYQKDQPFDLFIAKMRGEAGSSLQLQIVRDTKVYLYSLQRSELQFPIITSQKLDDKCYLSIANFDKGSANAFISQMQKLSNCRLHIFDLRGNSGGILDEVLQMLDTLTPESQTLLTVKSKHSTQQEKAQKADTHFVLGKTLILIDNGTASAAEIFAGVLKHYFPSQTYLIGERSYGKGSIQELTQLSNAGLLKHTIALRYIADQTHSIDQIWLSPDIKLIDNPQTPRDELLDLLWFKA